MRRISGPLTLAGFIGLALACQESDAPTTSTKDPAQPVTQGEGKVTAADGSFPSPGGIPSQPSPGGIPSQPSPGGGGVPSQPSPGNVPSQPSPGGGLPSQPSPTNPPSFPSPTGGGGGGGTPTPTPTGGTPTATPSGTPTPGICPASFERRSTDVPFVVVTPTGGFGPNEGGAGPTIDLTGFSSDCQVANVRVFFRVTATNLSTSTASGNLEIALDLRQPIAGPLVVSNANLVDLLHPNLSPLQGTQMGTSCGPPPNLRFQEGQPSFATAIPPYSGVFRPYGNSNVSGGTGNFNQFDGVNPNGSWRLAFYGLTAPVTVQCWTLQLDLVDSGGGGGAITGRGE